MASGGDDLDEAAASVSLEINVSARNHRSVPGPYSARAPQVISYCISRTGFPDQMFTQPKLTRR